MNIVLPNLHYGRPLMPYFHARIPNGNLLIMDGIHAAGRP
jgi:hypothetical protein